MTNISYSHLQSAHCENGVTTGLLSHYGVEQLNEPLVFGIGSGMFYIHVPFIKIANGPFISFRSFPGNIFKRTCRLLKVDVVSKKFRNPVEAQAFLDKKLEEGMPVGCRVGVYHLPYFPVAYRFHFNMHNTIVFGIDETHYQISDPVMEYTVQLTHDEFNKVRFAKGVFAPRGHLYYPENARHVNDNLIRHAIVKGIKRNSRDMLYVPGNFAGVKGIAYTSKKIRTWRDKLGLRTARLYLAQIVRMQEEIGTGGGGFRYLYAAFLENASGKLHDDRLLNISDKFTAAGNLWRNAAVEMAGIYKGRLGEQHDFDKVADMLIEIHHIEKQAFKELFKLRLQK